MKKWNVLLLASVLVFFNALTVYAGDKVLSMSTTTSTQASGLLDILLPAFKADTGIEVKVIAKGTGAAIRDGMDGNVDIIFVHAKGREEKFVAEGYGTKRYAVMHNDFVIIGPKEDPAGVAKTADVNAALKAIADKGSAFISRGDDSGTHTKEQNLWKASGVPVKEQTKTIVKKGKKKEVTFTEPENGDGWYQSIGQGMGKTLTFADEKKAYTMTDRGTYIKYKFGKTPPIDLVIVSEGSENLANPYGVIPVNPEKFPEIKYDLAKTFAEWVTSEKGQKIIGDYRLIDKQLFYPDAIPQ
ncbi:MAG: tungsten ABC transporter substrate-binding protein [Desulfobacterales bacterium]|nr:MAG: tungsten ABC transporter substrate-binding protein [Desulfobacterales bacterium]